MILLVGTLRGEGSQVLEIVSSCATVIRLSMIGTVLFYLKVQVLILVVAAALPLAVYLGLILELGAVDVLTHDRDLFVAFVVEDKLLFGFSILNLQLCLVVHYLPVDFLSLYRR